MHTLLIVAGGRQIDALLLSASPGRLRVVIPGRGDAVEICIIEGSWITDRGVRVEIGALMLADGMRAVNFISQPQVRTRAAV